MPYIFISYSKEDRDFTLHLRLLLQQSGFEVWMDEELVPSQRWWTTIEERIESCGAFVVVMTPASKESEWVEREILIAEKKENRKPIIPVLLKGEAWTRLANRQYANMKAGLSMEKLPKTFLKALQQVIPPEHRQHPFKRVTGEHSILTPHDASSVNQDTTSNREPLLSRAKSGVQRSTQELRLVDTAEIRRKLSETVFGWRFLWRRMRYITFFVIIAIALVTGSTLIFQNIRNDELITLTSVAAAQVTMLSTVQVTETIHAPPTITSSETPTATFTATYTHTSTFTPTDMLTNTATNSPSHTPKSTHTPTVTAIPTHTPTATASWTSIPTNILTPTVTFTQTMVSLQPAMDEVIMRGTTSPEPWSIVRSRVVFDNNYQTWSIQMIYVSSDDFWIDAREVNNAQYRLCFDADRNPCDLPNNSVFIDLNYDPQPVNAVNWFMARAYCERRGGRLPTKTEWEYSARYLQYASGLDNSSLIWEWVDTTAEGVDRPVNVTTNTSMFMVRNVNGQVEDAAVIANYTSGGNVVGFRCVADAPTP